VCILRPSIPKGRREGGRERERERESNPPASPEGARRGKREILDFKFEAGLKLERRLCSSRSWSMCAGGSRSGAVATEAEPATVLEWI
jgi:hypothetical protein